jgi:hypothetical protein
MPILEKNAWFTLAVLAATISVYAVLAAVFGFGSVANCSSALLAIIAFRPVRSSNLDERDREILSRAQLTAFRAFWVLFVGIPVIFATVKGWDNVLQIPMWSLATIIWAALTIWLAAQSLTTILLYRRGR